MHTSLTSSSLDDATVMWMCNNGARQDICPNTELKQTIRLAVPGMMLHHIQRACSMCDPWVICSLHASTIHGG